MDLKTTPLPEKVSQLYDRRRKGGRIGRESDHESEREREAEKYIDLQIAAQAEVDIQK